MEKKFTVSTEYKLNDFLGCDIILDEENNKGWLLQPHLVKKLRENFNDLLEMKRIGKTPGMPGRVLQKVKEGQPVLGKEGHQRYR